jgi:hypothetical protein
MINITPLNFFLVLLAGTANLFASDAYEPPPTVEAIKLDSPIKKEKIVYYDCDDSPDTELTNNNPLL